jgi:hypothetical protein
MCPIFTLYTWQSINQLKLTQADIDFILQATNVPDLLLLLSTLLLDPVQIKIGSTGLDDIWLILNSR